jgi:hypothetical protein
MAVPSEGDSDLIAQLDSFDAERRRAALSQLAAEAPPAHWLPEVNLHCHTFFSYNGYGYSPSRLAWEAYRYGLEVTGLVDFDVLDGVEEFLSAGCLLGLKTTAGFESRVFVSEYSDREINSPHEPGVLYLAGVGFTGPPPAGSDAARTLAEMAGCARRRNLTMTSKINDYLDPVAVDYERDVLPLTPAGNATERHLLVAYERRAREVFPDDGARAGFWSEKLGEPLQEVAALLDDAVALKNLIRSRLMKHGGVGYAAPEKGSFPTLEDVVAMTLRCGAVPSACWLDGTSEGEADPLAHFGFMRRKGIPTVTVIPDRNWNIADMDEKALKVTRLQDALGAAAELDMPVFVGTEMNKDGQKLVDTFDAPALAPYRETFLGAAHMIWGHTLLKMAAGVGFTGAWAEGHFGANMAARIRFFRQLGEGGFPGPDSMQRLSAEGAAVTPRTALAIVRPPGDQRVP